MKQGCISGIFRGEDSTGLVQISRKFDSRVLKMPFDGYIFAQQKKVKQAFDNVDSNFATIVHHRAATHGTVSMDNCHPFEHKAGERYVVGVHNGTIHTFSRNEDGKSFDVDSDWLYHRIARDGAMKALGSLSGGSYALVWAEKPSDKIFMAVNEQRPLAFAFVRGLNAMVLASEHAHLWYLAWRNGIEVEQIMYPAVDTIYEFDPKGDLRDYKTHDIEKIKYKPPAYSAPSYSSAPPVNQVVRQHGVNEIRDVYGAASNLNEMGFNPGEELEFVLHRKLAMANRATETYALFGEVINPRAVVEKAVINGATSNVIENMTKSKLIMVKALGTREITDRTTGKVVDKFVICSTPSCDIEDDSGEQLANVEDENSDPFVIGPRGNPVTKEEWERLTSRGCSHCGERFHVEEAGTIVWTSSGDSPVCAQCIQWWNNQYPNSMRGMLN